MGTVIAIMTGYFILSGQASRAFVEWKSNHDEKKKGDNNK